MSKQKTAVQILVDGLIIFGYLHSNEFGQSPKVIELINQAKEMEKEQIEEAYKYARAHWSREDGNAERYYKETYGGNK
jgi:hypothetical protein